jgi:hypothetical protein
MTAARPQIRTEQHGQAPALTTAVLSLCSRSPSPPTAGNSARTRCTISPASIAEPAPGAAGKGRGPRFEVTWHGPDGSGGHTVSIADSNPATKSEKPGI